jgi:hypothetical protein
VLGLQNGQQDDRYAQSKDCAQEATTRHADHIDRVLGSPRKQGVRHVAVFDSRDLHPHRHPGRLGGYALTCLRAYAIVHFRMV